MKILVIRPSPTGEELVKNLNKINIPAWHFSLFDFHPSLSTISLSKKINELYQSKVILVFSKKSIYYTNLYLIKNNLKWPLNVQYYAIGKSSAFFLYNFVKKKIYFPKKKEGSEGLLKILHKDKIKNSRIILLQGENGRTLIEKKLKKENFKISLIECYKRVLKVFNNNIEVKKWYSYKINALVVTNGEALYQLKNMISNANQIEWIFRCKIFVVGERLSKIAKKLGWKYIIVSEYANNESFIKKIIEEKFNSI